MENRIEESFKSMSEWCSENGYLIALYIRRINGDWELNEEHASDVLEEDCVVRPKLDRANCIDYNDVITEFEGEGCRLVLHNSGNLLKTMSHNINLM